MVFYSAQEAESGGVALVMQSLLGTFWRPSQQHQPALHGM